MVPAILALLAAVVLAGCGGGNAKTAATDPGGGGGTTPTLANRVQLAPFDAASLTLVTSPLTPITLTAIVLDANNNGLSGRTVAFSVTDNVAGPAFIDNVTPATYISDVNGQVTAKLNLGGTTTIRNLTVTVTVDSKTASQTVTVASSTIPTVAAANSIQVEPSSGTLLTTVTLVATVLDINNNVIPGKVVSFAATDNVLNPAFINNIAGGGVTDGSGQASAQLNLGANKTARAISVKVTVDTVVIGFTTVNVVAPSAPAPAGSIQLLLSSGSLPVSGAPVTLTAVVLDASFIGLAGKAVSYSVTDNAGGAGPVFINNISGASDNGGLVTASLNIGNNTTPRNVTINATVDSVTATATVSVTNAGPPIAHSVQLLVSSPTLPSAGAAQVDLTAVVLDANNNAMTNKAVTFAVTGLPSESAFLNNFSNNRFTDANGLVTAKLNVGADKTNRSVTVTITVDGTITASAVVAINGTVITIAGLPSVVLNSSLDLTASLKDSKPTPIAGQPLTITSARGNVITTDTDVVLAFPAILTTNDNGAIGFRVRGTVAGADIITVTGLGATKTLAINVNGSSFAFTVPVITLPATTFDVKIATAQTITVRWFDAANGGIQVNQPVLFSATRGTLSASTANTNAQGDASVSIQSPGTGLATVVATGTGVNAPSTTISLTYITISASSVTLQAAKSAVQVNVGTNTSNFTGLTAVVRDNNNNLVKGASVDFNIVTDPSGGKLSAPRAITDINGVASVDYIAGTTSSPQNGVRVDATVVDVNGIAVVPTGSIKASTFLTTGGQSLFIRMETDNRVDVATAGTFTKKYYALVTDAAGNPVPDTTVVFKLRPAQLFHDCVPGFCPGAYQKGRYTLCNVLGAQGGLCTSIGFFKFSSGVGFNPPIVVTNPVYTCINEDINFNGILDPLEDTDTNGLLNPGNVAGVNRTAETDNVGIAIASITYPRAYATWAAVTLTATITVAGTEFKQTIDFDLPGNATDYSVPTIAPPGFLSPFGENPCNVKD